MEGPSTGGRLVGGVGGKSAGGPVGERNIASPKKTGVSLRQNRFHAVDFHLTFNYELNKIARSMLSVYGTV